MRVGTIMDSNDATFFEDIFPMKDLSSSSNQEMLSLSSQELFTIPKPTISIEHSDNPMEIKMKLLLGVRDGGLQSPLVMISLYTLWMTLPLLF
jgi:hypothetical protein